MCEPTTLLAAASLAVGVVGSVNQATAQKDSLMYQGQVAENNAKTLELEAQDAQRRGEQDKINAQQRNNQVKGAQRVSLAARGLDLGEGTAKTLLDQTDYFGAVDQATIENNTNKDMWRIRVGAQNESDKAGLLSSKSNSIDPFMAGATTLIGGAGSVADKWYKYKTPTPAASQSSYNMGGANYGSGWF